MKKVLSLMVMMAVVVVTFSQNIPAVDKTKLKMSVKVEYVIPTDAVVTAPVNPQSGPRAFSATEANIGITWYDLQTNKAVQNRIHRFEDGTIGATWTMGMSATNFPDRGTGYNYFDGTNWGPSPTARLESVRAGWPSYSALGADEEGEFIVSHDFATSELVFLKRETKGTGAWTEWKYEYANGPATLSWPRHIAAGPDNNSIHILANSVNAYEGMTTAQVYSRSTDGGETWDIQNIIIDGMGSDDYLDLAADEIVWAEQVGNTIAFLCYGAWHDMFMMKSTDDGDTWEKTVIWVHPYPYFDWNVTIADTFFCVDNSATIALGPDGKAHVAFGINRVAHFETGTTYTLWPLYDGVGYWNEDMPTFNEDVDNLNALAPPQYGYASSEMIEDVNYVGWMQDVDGDGIITLNDDILYYRELGPSTMPSISVDEYGNVFILFASTTETYEIDVYNYKHVWARAFNATTGEWGSFNDLTSDIVHIFDECIYPQLTQTSDDYIYYMYNADITPGVALDDQHAYQENRQVFGTVEKTLFGLPVGLGEQSDAGSMTVSQNYPNPADGITYVSINTTEPGNLRIELTNLIGQQVLNLDKGHVSTGNHLVTLDVTGLEAGTYFYTVFINGEKVTKRMIIQ